MHERLHILSVEDDAHIRLFLEHSYKQLGLTEQVKILDDGEQAINYLAGSPPFDNRVNYPLPQMVLLDGQLPRKSGLDVVKWIRDRSQFDGLIVVMFSASGDNSDIRKAYHAGVNSYIQKPLTLSQFTESLQKIRDYWLEFNSPSDDVSRETFSMGAPY